MCRVGTEGEMGGKTTPSRLSQSTAAHRSCTSDSLVARPQLTHGRTCASRARARVGAGQDAWGQGEERGRRVRLVRGKGRDGSG